MRIEPSQSTQSDFAVSGHVGAGHAHSHKGFVQDDSAGFAVAVGLLNKAFPVDTRIESVDADLIGGEITVRTKDGGQASAWARRGVTPQEADLMAQVLGQDAAFSQAVMLKAFGRVYGQGVLEAPVAFQTACCLAVMDTFVKKHPGVFVTAKEDMPGKTGGLIGARVDINGVPVSVMALVNSNNGGLGPDEDLEGTVMLGDKARAMRELGLDRLPTIVLECKAFAPTLDCGDNDHVLWVRANSEADNTFVYDALVEGVRRTGYPYACSDTAYPRVKGEMEASTRALGERIAEKGKALASASTSAEKVALVAELALLVSQDAGGVTFMSNALHERVAGGGIIPGTSAVLSMAVSKRYIGKWKIPVFTPEDADKYLRVIGEAMPFLAESKAESHAQLAERFDFDEAEFAHLLEDEA